MSTDWEAALASLPRHRRAVDDVLARCADIDGIVAVLLVGSLSAGRGDAVSDVDLLVLVETGRFEDVWHGRGQLHRPALRAWDVGPRGSAGAHKWLSDDLVLIECLIAEPSTLRLAQPFVVLAGDPAAPSGLQRRAPISRAEVEAGTFVGDPVEVLYDALKFSVRGDATATRRTIELLEKLEY